MTAPLRRSAEDLDLTPLLAANSVEELDRALLEAAWRSRLSHALAIWRRVGSTDGALRGDWLQVLARGPAECLPADALVRAALLDAIDPRLPGGATVFSPCAGERSIGLVLASEPDEIAENAAAALVELHSALSSAIAPSTRPFQPPLPAPHAAAGDIDDDAA